MNRKLLLFLFAAVVVLLNAGNASAQSVSEGRNLLPVWMPCDLSQPTCQSDPRWAIAWKFGDIYLQRQVECSIDSSALNPNNLVAACIDYSGIDIGNDTQVPFASINPLVRLKEFLLAKLFDKPVPKRRSLPRYSSGSEAWIRGMWSTNGFVTSTPFFVPGAPWADSSEDQRTFYYQVANATSDPIVVATPDGFHMIYMAFKRLADGSVDVNYMVDWRLIDKNIPDEPGRHSLASKGPPVMIAGGQNGTFGGFHDKAAAVAVANPSSPAGYDLYVSYTVFTGNGTRNAASHIYVAITRDGGATWTSEQVSQSTQEVSGTTIVASLTGQVSLFYRGFGSSPTIYFTKRASNGNWSKPVSILDNTYPTLMAFDQTNVKVDNSTIQGVQAAENNIVPRSNAFPTAAIAHNGTIFVAVQECADAITGLPRSCVTGGIPQIMLMSSTDGGATFSQRRAADNGVRNAEPDGFGYFWSVGRDNNNTHPQIIPTLNCTVPVAGTSGCLLTYWESRTQGLTTGPDPFTGQPTIGIGGYHRLMDLRGALLNTNGSVNRSFQISKYPYRPLTKLVNQFNQPRSENVNDIARVNEVILPNGTTTCLGPAGAEPPLSGLDPGCIPRLNFYRNQSGGGVIYFAGDYFALARSASWVKTTGGSKVPTDPLEVPWVGWHAITTTNQNILPPTTLLPSKGGTLASNQIGDFRKWTPGVNGLPACNVGGSRNTDSYLFDISLGLLVTTPVTSKTTPSPGDAPFITFPVQVWNNSSQVKTVRFTLDPDTSSAQSSWSKTQSVKTGLGTINPNSSTVHIVYVKYFSATISPIRVQVTETDQNGNPITGAFATGVTFNASGVQQPSAGNLASSITVSDPITGSIQAGSIQAVAAANIMGSIQAGSIQAGSIQAGSIQAAWVVEASGDPTQPKTAFTNVDAAFLQDYNFRTRIYQLTSIGACVDTTGNTSVQYQARQVGNGSIQAGSIQAGSIQAGSIQAISAANGFPNDPYVDNALFLPKPKKNPQTPPPPGSTDCRIGECIEAPPPESEFTVVQLIAEAKTANPSIVFDPVVFPPAVTVASYWCDLNVSDCQVTEVGPDLFANPVPEPAVTATPNPVSAGSAIQFPANGYTVRNIGNRDAKARRYGFYLSKAVGDSTLHLLGNGQVDPDYDILLGFDDSFVNPLLPFNDPTTPGTFDSIAQRSLTIPANTIPGLHYLFLYADDLRRVSETHEENNVVKVAITVLPPQYKLIGLFSPCSGLTCGPRNSGASTPIAFQLSYDGVNAVDSIATKPRLKFYDSTGALLFSADPDDIAPGGSDWQYSSDFTWKYNWQTKNPVTGLGLPAGTYVIKVEVPATQQFDGGNGVGAVAAITVTVR